MFKYCKVLDEKTGLVQIGVGCPDEYYKEIGMESRNVQQSDVDGNWYIIDKCPMKTQEQKEQEEREQKILLLKEQLDEIDKKKIRSTSAIALNIATQADYAKLQKLEQQAGQIREQIQVLGGV